MPLQITVYAIEVLCNSGLKAECQKCEIDSMTLSTSMTILDMLAPFIAQINYSGASRRLSRNTMIPFSSVHVSFTFGLNKGFKWAHHSINYSILP